MASIVMIAADLVAIAILALGIYFTRHRRRDLLVAFVGVNVGVLAVAVVLSGATVALGLGLGLFGVLSIIRLRSSEISQREVAYYFASLALGLIAGLSTDVSPTALGLMALIIVALYVADHPRALARSRHLTISVDRAYTDEHALASHLERVLDGPVMQLTVLQIDLVNDTTLVDVRYRASASAEVGAALSGARR